MLELLASISGTRNATPSGFLTQIVKRKWAERGREAQGVAGEAGVASVYKPSHQNNK